MLIPLRKEIRKIFFFNFLVVVQHLSDILILAFFADEFIRDNIIFTKCVSLSFLEHIAK